MAIFWAILAGLWAGVFPNSTLHYYKGNIYSERRVTVHDSRWIEKSVWKPSHTLYKVLYLVLGMEVGWLLYQTIAKSSSPH